MRPYSHSILDLLTLLGDLGIDFDERIEACAKTLDPHYLQARYPDARLGDYSREEAEEAVKCMEVMLDFLQDIKARPEEG